MMALTLRMLALTLIALVAVSTAEKDANLTVELNPDCTDGIDCSRLGLPELTDSRQNLVYMRSVTEDDGVNHAFVSTIGTPSFLLLKTRADVKANVTHWTMLQEGEMFDIQLPSDDDTFVQAFRFNRLFFFADPDDTADVAKANTTYSVDLSEMHWLNATVTDVNGTITTRICTNKKDLINIGFGNGTFCLTATMHSCKGRDTELPKLMHRRDSIQVSVELDHVSTKMFGSVQRFAVELWFAGKPGGDMLKTVDATVDDEYTPGVFQVVEVTNTEGQAHVLWKPVAYTTPKRERSDMTQTKSGDLIKSQFNPESGIIFAAWQSGNWSDHQMMAMNVTIGHPKDGYYAKTNYAVWSISIGLGISTEEEISVLLLVIISVIAIAAFICLLVLIAALISCLLSYCKRQRAYGDTDSLITDADFNA